MISCANDLPSMIKLKSFEELDKKIEERRAAREAEEKKKTARSGGSSGSSRNSYSTVDPSDHDVEAYYEDYKDEFYDEDDAWDDFEDNEEYWDDY